jgi:hypothetical protein
MRSRVALLVVCIASVGIAAGGAAGGSRDTVKNTRGWIQAIAMDGGLVAYDVAAGGADCNRLFAWNVLSGYGWVVSGKGTCGADSTSTGAGVREIAIAGRRIAWIVNLGGNTESQDTLYTATLPKPAETKLADCSRTGDVDGVLAGDWFGGLVGDGSLLAVNRWTTDTTAAITKSSLERVGDVLAPIVVGQDAVTAQSADHDRVAVLRADGVVIVHSTSGVPATTIKPSSARDVALRKDYLVVLTKTRTLEVFNSNTGEAVVTLPVRAGASNLDLQMGIAVYTVGRRVYALRLGTGKNVLLAAARRAVLDVEIEAAGVVYAFNTARGAKELGNLVFIPMAKVAAAVS